VSGARHRAREAALQTLYLREVGRTSTAAALDAYFGEHGADLDQDLREFVSRLVTGVDAEAAALDALIGRHSRNWRIERLSTVDRLILRLAAWELLHEGETPAPVVLDEALELARSFSGDDAVRFINGVLDGILHSLGTRAES